MRRGPAGIWTSNGDVDSDDALVLRHDLELCAPLSLLQSLSCDVITELRDPGLAPDPDDLSGACSMADTAVMTRHEAGLLPALAPVCAVGSSADCCAGHAGVGCNVSDTVQCVCAQDPSCCTADWTRRAHRSPAARLASPRADPGVTTAPALAPTCRAIRHTVGPAKSRAPIRTERLSARRAPAHPLARSAGARVTRTRRTAARRCSTRIPAVRVRSSDRSTARARPCSTRARAAAKRSSTCRCSTRSGASTTPRR